MTSGTRFDPQTGVLRLSRNAVEVISRLISDADQLDPVVLDELRAGGIVDKGGRLHERLLPVAKCLSTPSVGLRLDCAGAHPWSVDGWIDPRAAVLLRASAAEAQAAADVAFVPKAMVPLNLARLLELGPRERVKVDGPVELDEGMFEALLGSGEAWAPDVIEALSEDGDEVLPEWLEVLTGLSKGPKRRWRVGAWWNSAEESPAARLLEVVEGDVGSFLLTHHRREDRRYRRVRLHPLSATQIWRLLCALVPSIEEVERPLTD